MHIASFQNVLIIDVKCDVDLPRMQAIGEAHKWLLMSFPTGIATLAFIRAGTPVASSASRAESARFIKALGSSILKTAMVLEDTGVLAQMLRAVVRGVSVLARSSRLEAFSNTEDAIDSVLPFMVLTGLGASPRAEFTAAVRSVRRSLNPSSIDDGSQPRHAMRPPTPGAPT